MRGGVVHTYPLWSTVIRSIGEIEVMALLGCSICIYVCFIVSDVGHNYVVIELLVIVCEVSLVGILTGQQQALFFDVDYTF